MGSRRLSMRWIMASLMNASDERVLRSRSLLSRRHLPSQAIVRRPEGTQGWVRLPIRWTVERTFAWLGTCRRLSKDREKSVLSSEAFVKLAMTHLMLDRLEPKGTDAEFHYRLTA